jgi:hypothetical protein
LGKDGFMSDTIKMVYIRLIKNAYLGMHLGMFYGKDIFDLWLYAGDIIKKYKNA